MSEKRVPLEFDVQIVFVIDTGHPGPNEHISQGAKKNSHGNPPFIGVKVHNPCEIHDYTKTLPNKWLHAQPPPFRHVAVPKNDNFY